MSTFEYTEPHGCSVVTDDVLTVTVTVFAAQMTEESHLISLCATSLFIMIHVLHILSLVNSLDYIFSTRPEY